MTKPDLECFGPLCAEIHLGTFDGIVHTSFETGSMKNSNSVRYLSPVQDFVVCSER